LQMGVPEVLRPLWFAQGPGTSKGESSPHVSSGGNETGLTGAPIARHGLRGPQQAFGGGEGGGRFFNQSRGGRFKPSAAHDSRPETTLQRRPSSGGGGPGTDTGCPGEGKHTGKSRPDQRLPGGSSLFLGASRGGPDVCRLVPTGAGLGCSPAVHGGGDVSGPLLRWRETPSPLDRGTSDLRGPKLDPAGFTAKGTLSESFSAVGGGATRGRREKKVKRGGGRRLARGGGRGIRGNFLGPWEGKLSRFPQQSGPAAALSRGPSRFEPHPWFRAFTGPHSGGAPRRFTGGE